MLYPGVKMNKAELDDYISLNKKMISEMETMIWTQADIIRNMSNANEKLTHCADYRHEIDYFRSCIAEFEDRMNEKYASEPSVPSDLYGECVPCTAEENAKMQEYGGDLDDDDRKESGLICDE